MRFNEKCEFLKELILSAGEIMRSADLAREDMVQSKGSANFVTEYDLATQEFLIKKISEAIPTARFIAEEKENNNEALSAEDCFIIDPIDGTANFINGLKHSCISLALVRRGVTVFGAIYDPYFNELFYAKRGEGAYLNGKPIHASSREGDRALVVFGSSPYCKDTLGAPTLTLIERCLDAFGDIRRLGSAALDLAYIAAGRFDLFFELKLSVWDFAAGEFIIREAGGAVSQLSGEPLSLDRPCSVFAGNAANHKRLLELATDIKI